MPRSASRKATGLEVMELPRSAYHYLRGHSLQTLTSTCSGLALPGHLFQGDYRLTSAWQRGVANAGLVLPAILAEKLGLRHLIDEHVHLGNAPGAGNAGVKAMTLIYSALAGGDSIEDANL